MIRPLSEYDKTWGLVMPPLHVTLACTMPRPIRRPAARTSWEPVSDWYKEHTDEKGTLIADVVHPGTVRLLGDMKEKRILDIACGEGALSRSLAKAGAVVRGFDASPSLIEEAKKYAPKNTLYVVGDATILDDAFDHSTFDGATCTLALQNIEKFERVFRATAKVLKPGAPFVFVITHPAFRAPKKSHWGWDEERSVQYRRMDGYLSSYIVEIQAHPGSDPSVRTPSYHRPVQAYVNALGACGLLVERMEEWVSNRESRSEGHGHAENIARKEFPMFLAIRAVKK